MGTTPFTSNRAGRRQAAGGGPRNYEATRSAADRIGVSEKTLRRWIAEGRLRGYRLGPRMLRVDADEVDALFEVVPTTDPAA